MLMHWDHRQLALRVNEVLSMTQVDSCALQRHILPYSPSPYVALALKLHRLVSNELNPHAFFKLVNRAPYRLALWLHFLFPYVRYLYLSRLVSSSGESSRQQCSTGPEGSMPNGIICPSNLCVS